MEYKTKYCNNEERETIISENTDKYLVREENISEGNFLVFSDAPIEKSMIFINGTEEIAQLENQIAETFVDLDYRLSNIELGL